MKQLIKWIVQRLGFQIVRSPAPASPGRFVAQLPGPDADAEHLGFDLEGEAVVAIRVVRRHTMQAKRRLASLYELVAHAERSGIPGAFVECGVWKGGAVGLMALANLAHGSERRHLHLFDVFDDIGEPDPAVDGARAIRECESYAAEGALAGRLTPLRGLYDSLGGHGTVDGNRDLLERVIGYDPERLHFHVGWFQETVPAAHAGIGDIAILRLDGDWYASTRVCLEHLFDHVVPGGIVIIDDYGCYDGCRKAVDEFLAQRALTPYLVPVDAECRFLIKSAN